jgi:PadR family transcriptional regulator, regulatory protein PadR
MRDGIWGLRWRSALTFKDTLSVIKMGEDGLLVLTFDTRSEYSRLNIDNRYKTKTMSRIELLQGTLDMLILNALKLEDNHGLGISRRIHQITRGTFDVRPGSLYTALHRLEEKGWLVSRWNDSENNRRAKYYQLTATGKRQLAAETENWERISLAITRALRA